MDTRGAVIDLTPTAATRIQDLQADDADRSFLRLYVAGRACCRYRYGLTFVSAPDPTDTVTESNGVRFVIDEQSRPHCEGTMIDFVSTPDGEGFAVRGPQIEGAGCGCGGGQV